MTKSAFRTSLARFVIEATVIVVSILLAFAIEAWWASSKDRDKEVVYLAQLESDLEGTLRNHTRNGGRADASELATVKLYRSYFEATAPPVDSLEAWWADLFNWQVIPQLGTVQALVATGDLELIEDDSLRVKIPSYFTDMTAYDGFEASNASWVSDTRAELTRYVDWVAMEAEHLPSQVRDSMAQADPWTPFPLGPLRELPDVDLVASIRDAEVHRLLGQMVRSQGAMRTARQLMRSDTEALLAHVRRARASYGASAR